MTKNITFIVLGVLILAGVAYFVINSYRNSEIDRINTELFFAKPSNLSTYEDLYRYLSNKDSLTMEELSGYRTDIRKCEKNECPVEQTELYKDLWAKNIALNPKLKEYCDKNPEILGINMSKDWRE